MERTLFLDAASPAIAVGLAEAAAESPIWRHTRDEAGVGLFRAADDVLRAAGLTVAELDSIVYCEGPGSLLGVRLVAIALRTWTAIPRATPLHIAGYRSLELVAADLLARGVPGPFHVIADGRRATWNALAVDASGAFTPIRRRPAGEPFPQDEPVYHPEGFPLWQALPDHVRTVAYDPTQLPALATRFPLLHTVTAPDAFMTETPTYREWTPEHPSRPH